MAKKVLKPLIWFGYFVLTLLLLWGSFAIFYSEIPYQILRILLAISFFSFGVFAIFIAKAPTKKFVLFLWLVILTIFYIYWNTLTPSHDRIWRVDMQKMPMALIDNDKVFIKNYRNFKYRSLDDFDVVYEDRVVNISHINSVDFFVSYWSKGAVAHTFVSFNFDDSEPITISIEARYESHEGFNPLASLFKEFELIYIIGSEDDIVKVRTNFRNEDVFMYRLNIAKESAQELFKVYLERINELYLKPEFYHLLSNNCTINIVRYANRVGRKGRLDIRLILNGFSDRYLYRNGYIDTSRPFREIRNNAHINDLAKNVKDGENFSKAIRKNLEN